MRCIIGLNISLFDISIALCLVVLRRSFLVFEEPYKILTSTKFLLSAMF